MNESFIGLFQLNQKRELTMAKRRRKAKKGKKKGKKRRRR